MNLDKASDESLIEALKQYLSTTQLTNEQQQLFQELSRRAGSFSRLTTTCAEQQASLDRTTKQLSSVSKANARLVDTISDQSERQTKLQEQLDQYQAQIAQLLGMQSTTTTQLPQQGLQQPQQGSAGQPTSSGQPVQQPILQTTLPTPPTTTHVPVLKPATPPKYNGNVRELQNWLFAMNAFFDASGVKDDMDKTRFAITFLEGRALAWWRTHPQATTVAKPDWLNFQIDLETHFRDTDSEYHQRQRFAALKQVKSVDQYIEKFRNLITEMGMAAPDMRTRYYAFLQGLKPAVRQQVLLQQPASLADAMLMAARTDSVIYNTIKYDDKGYRPMELGVATSSQKSNKNVKHVKQATHKRSNTPKRVDCWYCGKPGHIEKDCYKKQRDLKSSAGNTPRHKGYQNNKKGKTFYHTTSSDSEDDQRGAPSKSKN